MGSLWNRSGTIERYADDLKAAGALAYFFSGGTTSPLTVYQDAGESAAYSHPVVADAFGRWPDIFVPYILAYDVQVKTADGVQLTYSQNIPNPDPVEVTVTPDPIADVVTGMIHAEMINTTKAGYVRLNGRTIGNGVSGASERQNDDTEDLFTYLWNNLSDSIAPVSGGRGASAAADFDPGNKTITLPNWQGAMPVGLDDMGSSAGGFLGGLTFGTGNATTSGSRLGDNALTLALTQIPAHAHSGTTNVDSPTHTHAGTTGNQNADHTHSGTTGVQSANHTHTFSGSTNSDGTHTHQINLGLNAGGNNVPAKAATGDSGDTDDTVGTGVHSHAFSGTTNNQSADHTHNITTGNQSANHGHSFATTDGAHSHTFSTSTQGGGQPMNNLPRSILVTWYIKL